jgi:hypothetical protein
VRVRQSPMPVPAVRIGDVVAWDLRRPVPTPDDPARTWRERTFLLLDVGVQLKLPHWWREDEPETWYVDLVKVDREGECLVVRDLYLDLIVPTDGRPYRMLDLHEFGDALASGELSVDHAVDGLHRWQAFLDRHVHRRGQRDLVPVWRDFPPARIQPLIDVDRLPID